jgi:hypothetical protein
LNGEGQRERGGTRKRHRETDREIDRDIEREREGERDREREREREERVCARSGTQAPGRSLSFHKP